MPNPTHKIPHLAILICQLHNNEIYFTALGPQKSIIPAEDHVVLQEEESELIAFADKDDLQAAIDLIKSCDNPKLLRERGHKMPPILNRYRKSKRAKTYDHELENWFHAIKGT